jgi:plastocyanin
MMPKLLTAAERALAWLGNLSKRKLIVGACCMTAVEAFCLIAIAAQSHRIVQRGRAFTVTQVSIAAGDTIEFSNDDDFIHQIYIQSPQLSFDSEEQEPGKNITVKFPVAGHFEVRCHIHPKMLLKVDVS